MPSVLHDFLTDRREAVIERARARVASRRVPVASDVEIASGVPLFLSQLVKLLREEQREPGLRLPGTSDARATEVLGDAADAQGDEMLRAGFSVAQVVEGYGDVCQAITDEALSQDAQIGADEYRTLNLCLDVATARAVTAFSRLRDRASDRRSTERMGVLAHELRNQLATAALSFEVLRRGSVGLNGSTAAVLARALQALRLLIDGALGEVRLAAALQDPQPVMLAAFIEEIEAGATLDARARGLELVIPPVEFGLTVTADRQLLASAVFNLLQNAMKFTRAGGRVALTVTRSADAVHLAVEDECGGLPVDTEQNLFRAYERAGADQSGLGLGLKISRDAVRASGGEIRIRNKPGKGCVFTIELPARG
jgi:signal transduction histidine kinase